MKNILVKVHNSKQTVAEAAVVTNDGTPTTIKAQKKVNYELIDQATGHAPHHILVKRVGQDLQLSFDDAGQELDMVIEGFYDNGEAALLGMAEDGQYYYFVPDTSNTADYVTELAVGDIEGQALGGTPYAAPWWVSAGEASASFVPWLVALAGVTAAVGLSRDSKAEMAEMPAPTPKPTSQDQKVEFPQDAKEGDKLVLTIPFVSGTQTVTLTKQADGSWLSDKPSILPNYGANAESHLFAAGTLKAGEMVMVEKMSAPTTPTNTAPSAPDVSVLSNGNIKVALPKDLKEKDMVEITVPLASGTEKVTLTKQADGSLKSDKPTIVADVPANKDMVELPRATLREGEKVIAVAKRGNVGSAEDSETVPAPTTTQPTTPAQPSEPKVEKEQDGDVAVKPTANSNNESPVKLEAEYTNAQGTKVTFVAEKGTNGEWAITSPANPALSIDKKTGVVTIDDTAFGTSASAVVVKQTYADDAIGSFTLNLPATSTSTQPTIPTNPTAPTTPEKIPTPKVEQESDKDVVISPVALNNELPIKLNGEYTDTQGTKVTFVAEKGTNGEWAITSPANPAVTIDKTTGAVTIDDVGFGSKTVVVATQTFEGDKTSGTFTFTIGADSGNNTNTGGFNGLMALEGFDGEIGFSRLLEAVTQNYTLDEIKVLDFSKGEVTVNNLTKTALGSKNELYISGDANDQIKLGDVLQSGETVQTDGAGSWTRVDTKVGSTVAGDTNTYNLWKHTDGTILYIDQDIPVL